MSDYNDDDFRYDDLLGDDNFSDNGNDTESEHAAPSADHRPSTIESVRQLLTSLSDVTEFKKKTILAILDSVDGVPPDEDNLTPSSRDKFVLALKELVSTIDLLRGGNSNHDAGDGKFEMKTFVRHTVHIVRYIEKKFPRVYAALDGLASLNRKSEYVPTYMETFYEYVVAVRNEPSLRDHLFECLLLFELFNSPTYKMVAPSFTIKQRQTNGSTAAMFDSTAGRQFKAFVSPFSALHDDFSSASPFMRTLKRKTMTRNQTVDVETIKKIKATLSLCASTATTQNSQYSAWFKQLDAEKQRRDQFDSTDALESYDDIANPSKRRLCRFIRSTFKPTVDGTIRCSLLSDLFSFNMYNAGGGTKYRNHFSFYEFVLSTPLSSQ